MDSREVLTKAIEKAIANGWKPLGSFDSMVVNQWQGQGLVDVAVTNVEDNEVQWVRELEGIIFNHDFAKALWGEEATYDMTHIVQPDNSYRMNVRPSWQYHLQQMVVADDPIKYLEKTYEAHPRP